ncbi:MAG: low molecular weight phosphatase family protein [Bryobacteraceae bacterium]
MHKKQLAAVFLAISSMVLLPWTSVLAQQAPTQGVHGHMILFVCEHGSAKSVIAAAHFNDLANKNGLPYRAIARGIHPDKEIPNNVKSGLAAEDLDVTGWRPKRFSEEEALRAERVITLGCALPTSKSVTARKLQDWNDVPSPSKNYQNASQAIAERVASLLKDLAGKQRLQ